MRLALVLSLLLAPACMKAPDEDAGLGRESQSSSSDYSSTPETPQEVERPTIQLDAPESWTSVPPSMNFYLAAWELPEGGIANVTWLGGASDIIAQNVDRWIGQFLNESGSPSTAADADMERITSGPLPYTFVTVTGTMTATRQVGGGDPRQDWMLIGAVVESESGPLYLKVLGPETLLKPQADTVKAAVEAMQVN